MVGNVECSLQSESWWFFLFCQSGARVLKISGHRLRTIIFVFLISITVSVDYSLSLCHVYVVLTNFPFLIFSGGQIVKYKILASIGSEFQFWCRLHAFCNTK
jgi:hypothetical protein